MPVRNRPRGKGRHLSNRIEDQMIANGLPRPVREYIFHPYRRWKFDFAWPQYKLAVEVEGGQFLPANKSRHISPTGFQKDAEKYNEAVIFGWRVIRVTTKMIETPDAMREIKRAFSVLVDQVDPAETYPEERKTARARP